MNFRTPCSNLGVLQTDISTQNVDYLINENCISFNHFYSGFVDNGFAYAIYNDSSGDKIKKWGLNPLSEGGSIQIEGMNSIPFVNTTENLIYYLFNTSINNSNLSGEIKSTNYEGVENNSITFSTNILSPKIVANNSFRFLIEPNKDNFLIERINSLGQTDKSIVLEKTFHSSKMLENGQILILTHDDLNEEEPIKLYLLNQQLDIIGSIGFGVSHAYPVAMELANNNSIIYVSGIVNSSRLFDEEARKRNACMFVQISLSDLINSINIDSIKETEISFE